MIQDLKEELRLHFTQKDWYPLNYHIYLADYPGDIEEFDQFLNSLDLEPYVDEEGNMKIRPRRVLVPVSEEDSNGN